MARTKLPPTPAPKRKPNPKLAGLVVWWPLNDGPERDGTSIGSCRMGIVNPVFTSASKGAALFDTASPTEWSWDQRMGGYVLNPALMISRRVDTVQNNTEINTYNFDQAMTVGIWYYLNSFNTALGGGNGPVMFNHGLSGSVNFLLQAQAPGHAQKSMFRFTIGLNNFKDCVGATDIQLNRWNLIVGTYDGATMKVYHNGVLDGTFAQVGTPDQGNSVAVWRVGDYVGSTLAIDGRVWNAFAFKRVLGGAEIKSLFDNPFDIFEPPIEPPIEDPPAPQPPSGGTLGIGGIVIGDNAIPVVPGNRIFGPRSGHVPLI